MPLQKIHLAPLALPFSKGLLAEDYPTLPFLCSVEEAGDFTDKGIGFPAVGSFTLFMVFLVVFILIVIVVIAVAIAFLFGGNAIQDDA